MVISPALKGYSEIRFKYYNIISYYLNNRNTEFLISYLYVTTIEEESPIMLCYHWF